MNQMGDQGARHTDASASTGAYATTGAHAAPDTSRGETVMFLESPLPIAPLTETADYRPGALVALLFLALPAGSALALTALTPGIGAPVWLPLTLLLWIPALLAGWWALGGVRLTRETIAFGRPLRPWEVIPLDSVERLERHGPRLTVVTASGRRRSFAPALLARGAQLRRRLLLSLPIRALDRVTRAEALRLLEGAITHDEEDAADALTLRTPRWASWLAAALALFCALGAGAVLIFVPALAWLALAPGVAALLALAACLWLAQEIFISDRGVIARYTLLRLTGSLAWSDVRAIWRAPGEVALVLRGPRPLVCVVCAGPRLLAPYAARLMREAVSEFAIARGTPVTPRPRR